MEVATNRICAVQKGIMAGVGQMFGYIYDADGNRVAKGTISSWSCDTASNGFQVTSTYALDLQGQAVTENAYGNGGSSWVHTDLFADGQLMATYDPNGRDCVMQVKTGRNTEAATATTGGCSGVAGNGTTQTYVSGTITSLKLGADGKSIDIDSNNADGSSTVTNANFSACAGQSGYCSWLKWMPTHNFFYGWLTADPLC